MSMGGTKQVEEELFVITSVLDHMKKHKETFNGSLPRQGIIAMGTRDVNWGWLR